MKMKCPTCGNIVDINKTPRCPRCMTQVKVPKKCEDCKGCNIFSIGKCEEIKKEE